MREQFPALGSQMVCQAVHRVADAYRTLKANKGIVLDKPVLAIAFEPTSVNYDARTHSLSGETFSLFTLDGRIKVAFACGQHQRNILQSGKRKEARLVIRRGAWYLNVCVEIGDAAPKAGSATIGLDVGENNLAATSTGKIFGGGQLRHHRDRFLAERRRLQANGSRAAKRKLRAVSGREGRHVRHVNHETSKQIIAEAIRADASEIRMEDLTRIRDRIKAGRRVRTRLHRWAFRQLQDFVAYKAQSAGIRVVYVNPAYTSQTCSACGGIGKRVRHSFTCLCGTRLHSDANAALNIAGFAQPIGSARGGKVTRPVFTHLVRPGAVESPALQGWGTVT